jgi:CBS domain containing-hemolysin-like protein
MSYLALLAFFVFFVGLFGLSLFGSALGRLSKRDGKKIFKLMGHWFYYRSFLTYLFPKFDYEEIAFSITVSKSITRFLTLMGWAYFLYLVSFGDLPLWIISTLIVCMTGVFYLLSDYLPRVIASHSPIRSLWTGAILSSPYMIFCFPLIYLFMKISMSLGKTAHLDYLNEPMAEVKHEIFEILQEANLSTKLSPHDRKLIESVVYFQNRITREVMIPRMDMFCLNAETTIKDAVQRLEDEGYSRVPVYKDTIDNIVGVLMYKDILTKYIEYQKKNNDISILEAPIETILKRVIYTPESKKISNLLQDFRKKQVHLAIVVDEYGGTEGIVTIEDILEEIVGEIEDEYDDDEELYAPSGENCWIVDARMTLIDAEEQLGIELPQGNDYDTIGGFIFDRAGTIPSRGFTIKLDNVELEILKSNDRRVEKVKIKKTSDDSAETENA